MRRSMQLDDRALLRLRQAGRIELPRQVVIEMQGVAHQHQRLVHRVVGAVAVMQAGGRRTGWRPSGRNP
jgi:hypothetical protein